MKVSNKFDCWRSSKHFWKLKLYPVILTAKWQKKDKGFAVLHSIQEDAEGTIATDSEYWLSNSIEPSGHEHLK